ncbi:putative glycosyltransferase [Actinoplanes missouriensis 431]|uniref:Putative glycosyltransferase n=1 Tax=Actinoplanes missouriensis (strain ATCC 14538 / DSM 43046 / CBS 188.64 / JCM 3121 / NBRC 102363 / NCIMB 12654 / NRRL B-3342 / UNCC 431) TaxID=512565 RepID=I0HGA5_ACTM4|nr:glycosyltransferase family 2 protein [Actinoplanes missouriensis]BAL92042.1 putative glycosyltransferase [Actinoplanes missouriensis 431]
MSRDFVLNSLTLSVVTPMYNEREAVDHFVARLRPVLDGLGVTYEVVAVDDGSRDETVERLLELREDWSELRVVKLRRNVGHQSALAAGLKSARGEYVVSIDADLQDPPETIGDMLAKARSENLDVVYGVRSDRSTDTSFKRNTAGVYYWLMRKLVGPHLSDQAGDFRLMSRVVVDTLNDLQEQQPVYRLVVPSLGFASGEVTYVRAERVAGETKYPLTKMIKLSVDSVTSFSAAPLRVATWLGLVTFMVCLGLVVSGIAAWGFGVTVPGWTSLYIAVLLLGAVQLICLGLLGEYVGRIYAATQNRPKFLVAFDTDEQEPMSTKPEAVSIEAAAVPTQLATHR